MTDLRKAAEMSLDVLRNTVGHSNQSQTRIDDAKHALVQALAQPEWVGLTDDEIDDWFFQRLKQAGNGWALDDVVRAVEAKLKEKNT